MGSVPGNIPTGDERNGRFTDNADDDEAGLNTTTNNNHPDAPISSSPGDHLEELREGNPSTPLPRFLEESSSTAGQPQWKRWIPYPVRRLSRTATHWARGPQHPKPFRIGPVLPAVQHAPIWLLDTYLPRQRHRAWALAGYVVLWVLTFALVKHQESSVTELKPYGAPVSIGCGAAFWDRGNYCGLNGDQCRPFRGSEFAFRCPADCASRQLGEPRAVGDQELNYRSLIIGGPVNETDDDAAYRGDSWICPAAIHDGAITNAEGGCGIVRLVGSRSSYSGSSRNALKSVGFDSYFPKSFVFEAGLECKAKDLRWSLLAVDVVYTSVLSLFTTSPAVFFFTILSGVFWHVGLVSDPPVHSSFLDLFTTILGKYIPIMFVAWVMYEKMGIKRTLTGLSAQVEKTILWLGACWVGALDNYTLSAHIPIQRLNAHDINQQPGAKAALAIIIIALFCIVLKQIWFFRQEGRLIRYGKLYLLFVGGIVFCTFLGIWDLNLRLHHYFLALLLLPGTSMQTRPALFYQGLLIGLFINGIARWGWDPILQTSDSLRGGGQLGSVLPTLADVPQIQTDATLSNITFEWKKPSKHNIQIDGISVLINDVERFRGFFEDDNRFKYREFTWVRKGHQDIKEYFRFAYMSGTRSLDYTKAGVWDGDLSWQPMKPGASSIGRRSLYSNDDATELA